MQIHLFILLLYDWKTISLFYYNFHYDEDHHFICMKNGLKHFPGCFRQEALRAAERERRKKYKAQNDEREVVRSAIREKVGW